MATWPTRELHRASTDERALFEFSRSLYRTKPLLMNSVLSRVDTAFQQFDQARRLITNRLNEWGARARTDKEFGAFLEKHVRRFATQLVFLSYVEIALAVALDTQTSPSDNPLELGLWELGAEWCSSPGR